jgi:hypothetical protein
VRRPALGEENLAHSRLMTSIPEAIGGHRASAAVQPPDVMPTLLELEPGPGAVGAARTFARAAASGEGANWPRRAAVSGTDLNRGEGKTGPR